MNSIMSIRWQKVIDKNIHIYYFIKFCILQKKLFLFLTENSDITF